MSIEVTPTLEDSLIEGLQELLDAPPVTSFESASEEDCSRQKRKRHRKGENVRPTPLQLRYQRQVRGCRLQETALVNSLSKMVAWTWMPGRDRKECPPIVDARDPRLLVMNRFPHEPGGPANQIGLAMYRTIITKQGLVSYAAPDQLEMFKDFSIRPHFRAGGLCLDSRNEEVFKTALALDHALEMVARGKAEPVNSFVPPPCLFGFPKHYIPGPEWRAPMQDAVLKTLQPNSAPLRCLLSPGGTVNSVIDTHDGFRTINMEKEGNLVNIRVPDWTILDEKTTPGNLILEGSPLVDLPRGHYSCIKDVTQRYPFSTLEWLEKRIMDELTEMISVDEEVYDKQTRERVTAQLTWRCVPARFVQNQMHRAVRFFLDFRNHLGRQRCSTYSEDNDVWTTSPNQVRVDVACFSANPVADDLYTDDSNGRPKNLSWSADMMAGPTKLAWAPRIPLELPPVRKAA